VGFALSNVRKEGKQMRMNYFATGIANSAPLPMLAGQRGITLLLGVEGGDLREGLDDTLTVQALGIEGALYRTLRTTNPVENLNGSIAHFARNVKRWKDGQMTLLWHRQ
jgi:putative transposase